MLTYRLNTLTREMTRWLVEVNDVRTIGVVIDMWYKETQRASQVRPALERLLIRLLLRLQPTNADLLNDRQRRRLHEELTGYNATLVLAILQGLKDENCGTGVSAYVASTDRESTSRVGRVAC